jgi:hypothetical protein
VSQDIGNTTRLESRECRRPAWSLLLLSSRAGSPRDCPQLQGVAGLGEPAGHPYRSEGEAAFEPRSRRPHRQPTAIPLATAELVIRLRRELTRQGLDAGALMRTGDAVVLAVQVSVGSGACAGSTMSATVRGGWRTVWPTANGVTACSRTFSALSPFRKRC